MGVVFRGLCQRIMQPHDHFYTLRLHTVMFDTILVQHGEEPAWSLEALSPLTKDTGAV